MVMASQRVLLTLMVITILLICIPEPSLGAECYSIGWGGCTGRCSKSGEYCTNFGRPPRNRCRCVK
ncbi:hypothetical protein ACJMK2_012349 [Sinanodonta woodiana]|uniref:Defensin n=1 Tax=Sinanodonta woodiana TaxID=1069815 RepID=A0ABD3VAZ7_SINWO